MFQQRFVWYLVIKLVYRQNKKQFIILTEFWSISIINVEIRSGDNWSFQFIPDLDSSIFKKGYTFLVSSNELPDELMNDFIEFQNTNTDDIRWFQLANEHFCW